MIPNPEERAAAQFVVALSADIELQLSDKTGSGPVLAILAKARGRAMEAISRLAEADPEDPKGIRALQNDVTCFRLILEWMREIVADGFDAGHALDADAREDLADALGIDATDDGQYGRPDLSPATDD